MPLISVIVPNYNHAPYLRQRLDSIFNQTFQDFEVIILDDCSTDYSKEIIEEYRDRPQVSHIVYNETNSGFPFKQWAKGFDLAQGEYIWIAESDDWAEPFFLEETVASLQANTKVSLAFTNSNWFSEDKSIKNSDIYRENTLINGDFFLKEKMIKQNSICNASGVLFKKEFLCTIPPYYQSFKGCGDWLFWIEFCLRGDVYYISKVLNHFRQHGNSTTKKNNLSGKAHEEYLRIFRYLKERKKISFLRRHCSAVFFITLPQKRPDIVKGNPMLYNYICQEWRKEIWNPTLSRIYVDIVFILWNIKKFIFSLFNKKIDEIF